MNGRVVGLGVLCALVMLVAGAATAAAAPSTSVVVSQVYGGGGNAGATYTHDFIELFNRGSSDVSLNGWSVQYASTTGTSWQRTNLTNVTLRPGQYYLVREAQGTGGTTPLPEPDALGSIPMAGGAGKIALVSNQDTLAGACPTAGVVDLVGYGTGTNCAEGAPTATLSNTTAALRRGGGCVETDQNSTDFAVAAPAPRNTGSVAQRLRLADRHRLGGPERRLARDQFAADRCGQAGRHPAQHRARGHRRPELDRRLGGPGVLR